MKRIPTPDKLRRSEAEYQSPQSQAFANVPTKKRSYEEPDTLKAYPAEKLQPVQRPV